MQSEPPGVLRPIPIDEAASIGDYRRYPGARLTLTCAMCGWVKPYNPERVLARLHELKSGGHATRMAEIARRVQWPCPGCHRVRWRAGFAWPPGLTAAEVKRLAGRYRN